MFGYLNLGNAKAIRDTDAQEAVNVRVDRGWLEYATWATSLNLGREASVSSIISGGRVYNDDAYPDITGSILWDYLTITGDVLGIAAPVTAEAPTIEVVTPGGGFSIPPGVYKYAVTTYFPVSGEESAPWISPDITITTLGEVAKFTDFHNFETDYPKKTSLSTKIYRRSPGSGEFLLVATLENPWPSAVYDVVIDQNLGEACDTFDNLRVTTSRVMAFHSNKLWIANGSVLQFSKTDKPWAFPVTFQLGIGDTITGLYPFGENLIVTTLNSKPKIIYGNDEEDFSVKDIDSVIPTAYNAGRIISGALIVATEATLPQITTPPSTGRMIDSISILSSVGAVNISNQIKSLFPRIPYYAGSSIVDEPQTGVVENRFYILKTNDTPIPMATAAAVLSTNTKAIVYDIHAKGFLMGDSTATFRYRTKEFSVPPRDRYVKRLFVEYQGTVSVEIYLDGNLATTMSFASATKKLAWFSTKPWRCESVSLRFVGQPTAKVYGFGFVDPAIVVGG